MAKPRTRDEIAAAFGEQPKRSRADIENAFNVPRQGAPRLTVTLPGGRGLATDLPDTPAPIGELGARVLADNRQRAPRPALGGIANNTSDMIRMRTLSTPEAIPTTSEDTGRTATLGDRLRDKKLALQAGTNTVLGGIQSLPNLPNWLMEGWTQGANSILRPVVGRDVFYNDVPRASTELSDSSADRAARLRSTMSTYAQRQAAEYPEEGLGRQIKYVMTHPDFVANTMAENAPQFATLAVPGGVGTKLLASGALGTGMMQDQISRDNESRVAAGEITQEQANAQAALGGLVSGAQNVLLPRVLGRFGGLTLERAASGLRPATTLGSRTGAITQGLLGEGAQGFGTEYADQIIQNAATGRPLTEGATGAAVLGTVMEGPLGGLVAGAGHRTAYDILRDPNATAGDKYDALQWIEQHGTNAEKAAVAAQSGVIIAPDAAPTTPTAPTVPARELGAPGAWAGAVPVPARPTGAFTAAVQAARDHAAATVQVTQEQAQEAAQAAQDAVATQSEPEAVGAAIRAAQETQQTAQQAAQIAGLADADILDHLAGLLDEEPNGQTDAVEGGEIAGANPAESGAVAPVVPVDVDQAQVSTAINAKPDEQAESRASAASQAASLQAVPQDAAVAAANSVANPANLLPDLRGGEEVVMQNRDRKRAASVLQMQDIRRNPDPDRLGFSRDPNTGAPMISEGAQVPESDKGRADIVKEPDGTVTPVRYAVVEADSLDASHDADGNVNPNYANAPMKALNNGRTAGLQAAHDTGNAQDYVRGIIADSGLHGVSQEAIASKRKPILVRLFDPALNVGDMGARSNAQQQLGLSPVEQAQTDARALPDLSGLEWNEDGSISPMRNANFFRAWFANLGATQAANLQNKNGHANAMALQRVRAALVQRAYGDERLLSALTEDVDPDNRNVVNALARAAPGFAKLDDTPLARDVKTALVEGLQALRDAKERGLSVDDALAQVDMFGRDPDADMAARYMALNARSAKRMAEAFAAVAEYAARAEQQAATLDVFGDAPQHAASDALHSAGITEKEHGATNRDDAGVVGEGNGSRQQVESERAATSDAGAFQLESQQSAEAKAESQVSQSGLFAPPTAQEHNRAAREAKDAERNGLGRDVVRPEQGEGDLLAGDRPEQSRIDDNAPKPSRTPKPTGSTATTIRAAITKAYGGLLARAERAGLVEVHQTEAEALQAAAQARAAKSGETVGEALARLRESLIPVGEATATEGFFDPQTGKAFLIADALTPATAPGTFMHEVGIHASPEIAGVFDAAAALVANPGVNKWAQQAAQRMASAGETSPEEAAAYLVTAYENDRANAPGSVRRWVRDFIAAVKAWLRRHNLPSGSIGVPEIAAIARANARATQRRAAGSLMASQQDDGFSARNNNIMFSRAPANVLANVRAQMAETEQRIGGREAYEASGSTLPYQVWVGSQTPAYQAFAKQAAPEAMKQEPGAAKPEKPKAAKPQEPEAPEPPENVAIDDVTGIAHEYSQKYMREIGGDEITKDLPLPWQKQLAAALTEYMGKGDPEQRYAYGQDTVEGILNGQPPSGHVEALLSVYLRDLKNRQIDLESRPESDILAQAELAQNQQRQMAIHVAMFKGGSALGRALNIRRMLLKKDFSYEALVRRELSRNGGKALDKATQDKLREMADTIAKQTKRLEELEAALADKAAAAAFAHARRRSASRARSDREWEDRAAAARRRIASAEGVKSRNKQAGAVMSPALLYDYATLGAYHVRKGALELADMIAAIRADIGSVIDEWLDDMPRVHALAKKLAQSSKETPSDVAADIKDREPTAADVLRMMRALAAAGVVSHVEAIEQASKLLKMDNATVRQMLIDGTPSAHTRSETAQIVSDIRKAARLESEIERLEAQRPKQVKPRTVRKDSPEVAAKREELRALKQSLRERGEDVDFNAQQERHYERRAAYWQNRIDTGDYNDTPKAPRAIANAVAQARLRAIESQNAFIEWQYEQSLKDMTRAQRAMHRAFNLLQMPRAIQSSSDLSALGRQGLLLGLGHPVVFAKAAWDTIGAAFSQAKYEAIHHDIRENPAYANAVIDGVEFTDLNAGSLTRREEIFASRLLAKIPVYFGGGVLRGSQRQYTAFLNVLRLNAYTSMMANQDRGAGKALAGVVNAFSGRGNFSNQKLANMMVGASTVFYAPRFAVSRLQTVVGQPIWRSEARGYRAVVAKEYGRMFLGMSAYMALLALAVAGMRDDDDDSPLITFDWRSSDFSKFRMGGVRLDPLAGLAQWVTLIGRQVTGETETDGKVSPLTTGGTLRDLEIWLGMDVPPHKMGKDGKLAFGSRNGANIIQDFLRSKLAPIPGAYLNWRAGETPGGDKTDLQTELLGLVHPLSYGDIVDGFRADTSNMQRAGIAAASIFGIGVQARSSQDDAQLARFNQRVQQARDDVRTRLMALPMDQWESALEAMRPEYGPLLDGTTLQIYQRDGKYGYAGEPARDDQGRPKLKNTRLATDYRDAANAAPGEEVNHIIPDNLVRHHPLMARAREFGFDLDAPENLLAMPRDPEPGRVAHHGDHKHYDAQVYKELQRAQRRLKNRFDSLDAAPPQDVLREVRRVQDDMRKRLESGDVPTKDGRLVMRDNQTNTRVA